MTIAQTFGSRSPSGSVEQKHWGRVGIGGDQAWRLQMEFECISYRLTRMKLNNQSRNTKFYSSASLSVRWMLLSWMLLALVSSTGCNVLFGRRAGPAEELDLTQLQREGYSLGANGVMRGGTLDDSSVLLEVNDGKKHLEKIPMTEGQPMFVADVIRDSQLHKKVGRIHVRVVRPNGTAAPVRMDIDFDESGRRVKEGTNYSLRAGDRVVVTKDDSNFISRRFANPTLSGMMR